MSTAQADQDDTAVKPMDVTGMTELERANAGKAFWQQYCLAGWQLMGWTDDVTATFIDGKGRCLEMRPGHLEIVHEAEQAARAHERRKALEGLEAKIVWAIRNSTGSEDPKDLYGVIRAVEGVRLIFRNLSTSSEPGEDT